MPSRKRTRGEANGDNAPAPTASRPPSTANDTAAASPASEQQPSSSLLHRMRNLWQFANLYQWMYTFGKAIKIDDNIGIEDLETECLKPGAPLLKDIGLRLLQFLSSYRGLTPDVFEEYARRQFLSKAPDKNPFGDGEVAVNFDEFHVLKKIRILQQLTAFAMILSDRLRERMDDPDQTQWRIEPYGWDEDERTYFVLDDNRVYRQTETLSPPPPAIKPSKKTKAGRASLRASQRRRTASGSVPVHGDNGVDAVESDDDDRGPDNGLGGMKWECVVVTLGDLRAFLATLRKTKDENTEVLRDRLEEHLLPILEKQEEFRLRQEQARERELLNLARLANAKRSSRIADKAEKQRIEEQAREEERKRALETVTSRKEADRQRRLERERDERIRSRAGRLQERQVRRAYHEEELAQLSEGSRTSHGGSRLSERQRATVIEKAKQALQELGSADEDWIFDCVCGVYGRIDDGTHSIACEKCNVWQHSACAGISEKEADCPDFHFACPTCRRLGGEEAKKPRTTIKLKINRSGHSPSTVAIANANSAEEPSSPAAEDEIVVEIPERQPSTSGNAPDGGVAAAAAAAAPAAAADTILLPPPPEQPVPQPSVPAKKPQPQVDKRDEPGPGQLQSPQVVADAAAGAPLAKSQTSPPSTKSIPAGVSPPPVTLVPNGAAITNGIHSLHAASASASASASAAAAAAAAAATPALTPSTSRNAGFPPSTPVPNGISGSPIGSFSGSFNNGSFSMSTLPPSDHGLSPVKHSPPVRPQSSGGNAAGASSKHAAQSPIFPPATTLAPSPHQQILTPPSKQPTRDPARR